MPSSSAPCPRFSQAVQDLHGQALSHHRQGQPRLAADLYRQVLAQDPDHAQAMHMLGLIEFQAGHLDSALSLLERVTELSPDKADAYSDLGVVLQQLHRHAEALASYDHAIKLLPTHADAHSNRGNALQALLRHDQAISAYRRALQLRPSHASALYNLGNCAQQLNRHADAIGHYEQALALRPDYPEALSNRASSLRALDRHDLALASCEAALLLRPDFPDALHNRATALRDLGRLEEAVDGFTRLLAVAPDYDYAVGTRFHLQLHGCDWRGYHAQVDAINQAVVDGKRADLPFSFLAISQSPAAQLRCASTYVADRFPPTAKPLWQGQRHPHQRIRLAYVSADFHDHPMAHMMAGLFEAHDRDRFELIGISFGPDSHNDSRKRLRAAFDRFIDVRALSDHGIASLLRDMEVDIAVDRKGFTAGARTGIFALRPAPIQVNYLAYPGSMGASYIDYIVADAAVLPPDQHRHYAESVVTLPDSFQANDGKRRIAEETPTRASLGLPDSGFVFCCFNNSYKISPDIFDIWMRLLHQVDDSVLWLLDTSAQATRNLRSEAMQRGIAPERLVFAERLPQAEHLARHRNADLFIDTLPYNAHTTASDALWAGLPVLACMGNSFASRVSSSLLHAVGLPELIAHSLTEYEAMALQLAHDRPRLTRLRQTLARNRSQWPLFDTSRFCRHMEAAYSIMWQRHLQGEAPAAFSVPALP